MTDVLQPSPMSGSSNAPSGQTTSPPEPAHACMNGPASSWPDGIPTHMTWEEYLAWDFEECRAEWVDGEVVLMPPVRAEHQFISSCTRC